LTVDIEDGSYGDVGEDVVEDGDGVGGGVQDQQLKL
jgi:hypothetical protein